MANTKSAEKRNRKSEVRRARNRQAKSQMRTAIKKLRSAVESGDSQTATGLLSATLQVIDTSARKAVVHRKTAARYKSRLTRAVGALQPKSS